VKVTGEKRFTVLLYLKRDKHIRAIEQHSGQRQKIQQLLLTLSKSSFFNTDLCKALIVINILINK